MNKEIIDLASTEFLSRLAYVSDIFDSLNHMYMFFQGPNSTISDFVSKLPAYLRKLDLWTSRIEAKQNHMFKDLSSLQHQHSEKLFQEICCHLKLLKRIIFRTKIVVRMFQIRSLWIHPFYLLEQENKRKLLPFSLTTQLK